MPNPHLPNALGQRGDLVVAEAQGTTNPHSPNTFGKGGDLVFVEVQGTRDREVPAGYISAALTLAGTPYQHKM